MTAVAAFGAHSAGVAVCEVVATSGATAAANSDVPLARSQADVSAKSAAEYSAVLATKPSGHGTSGIARKRARCQLGGDAKSPSRIRSWRLKDLYPRRILTA
jgi:hypothetical protein